MNNRRHPTQVAQEAELAERLYAVSDHADAAARLLLEVVRDLRIGTPPEQVGERVELLGRMMRRAI